MLDIQIPDIIKHPPNEYPKGSHQILVEHGLEMMKCEWNTRVWTFQEWMLPPAIIYTEETDRNGFVVNFMTLYNLLDELLESAMHAIKCMNDMVHIQRMCKRNVADKDKMYYLMKSGRKCLEPRDYYYGIAGVFDIHLPDGVFSRG